MSPAAGDGANIALRDAAALTTTLTGAAARRPLHAALRDYEQTMVPRSRKASTARRPSSSEAAVMAPRHRSPAPNTQGLD
ncbi:hypothetical protein ACIBJI_42295 [Nocardia sp. NPDC050408]|uniref:hypothetical protein n=1 Tax=unclassified Nocardia TaxID=2637762 RepID=UPI0034315254